ncbi:hypothetical protein U1Q18_051645 [Sarracenia purpurea var. burkii]
MCSLLPGTYSGDTVAPEIGAESQVSKLSSFRRRMPQTSAPAPAAAKITAPTPTAASVPPTAAEPMISPCAIVGVGALDAGVLVVVDDALGRARRAVLAAHAHRARLAARHRAGDPLVDGRLRRTVRDVDALLVGQRVGVVVAGVLTARQLARGLVQLAQVLAVARALCRAAVACATRRRAGGRRASGAGRQRGRLADAGDAGLGGAAGGVGAFHGLHLAVGARGARTAGVGRRARTAAGVAEVQAGALAHRAVGAQRLDGQHRAAAAHSLLARVVQAGVEGGQLRCAGATWGCRCTFDSWKTKSSGQLACEVAAEPAGHLHLQPSAESGWRASGHGRCRRSCPSHRRRSSSRWCWWSECRWWEGLHPQSPTGTSRPTRGMHGLALGGRTAVDVGLVAGGARLAVGVGVGVAAALQRSLGEVEHAAPLALGVYTRFHVVGGAGHRLARRVDRLRGGDRRQLRRARARLLARARRGVQHKACAARRRRPGGTLALAAVSRVGLLHAARAGHGGALAVARRVAGVVGASKRGAGALLARGEVGGLALAGGGDARRVAAVRRGGAGHRGGQLGARRAQQAADGALHAAVVAQRVLWRGVGVAARASHRGHHDQRVHRARVGRQARGLRGSAKTTSWPCESTNLSPLSPGVPPVQSGRSGGRSAAWRPC